MDFFQQESTHMQTYDKHMAKLLVCLDAFAIADW